VYIAINLSSI